MPIVDFQPGQSLALSKCENRNPMEETTVKNTSGEVGHYSIAYDLMPLTVQFTIEPGHSSAMCPTTEGTISNDGKVALELITPGL